MPWWTLVFKVEIVCVLIGPVLVKYARSQGGGNALQLQQMNMNLMSQNNGHCEYPICQTVCQQLNQQTGCYECNADCGTGSGMSLGGGNIMPYGGFYSCSPPCKVIFKDGKRECSCNGQTQNGWQVAGQPTATPRAIRASLRPTAEQTGPSSNYIPTVTSRKHATSAGTTYSINPSNPSTSSKSPPVIRMTSSTVTQAKRISPGTSHTLSTLSDLNIQPSEGTETANINYKENRLLNDKSSSERVEDKTNIIIIFALTTALVVSWTICIVFFIAWRRTAKQLQRQQNELYFVNKAIRQDSLASKTSILPEPVYAHITQAPEPPPRTPPITPITPSAPLDKFLLRTVSLSSETPLKETEIESETRHEYLDLI